MIRQDMFRSGFKTSPQDQFLCRTEGFNSSMNNQRLHYTNSYIKVRKERTENMDLNILYDYSLNGF